ncbi:MAG: TlpA family protein disulfide reductase [Cryomorphaceae bacterium]|nr:TlpA family protein disulfide reductase [Cryomorphaceae bacterium]
MNNLKKQPLLFLSLAILALIGLSFMDGKISSQSNVGLSIGDVAPELNFPSPDGENIKLSSLRGKIVLIDFWASWCQPCRVENPNVVRIYDKYHDKKLGKANGFEVYSVSLDQDKNKWVDAIKKDNLKWGGHVSDLKFWKSEAARIYNISSIPYTVLIDENGVIIGKNLRGPALERALANLNK